MVAFDNVKSLQNYLSELRKTDVSIGFVPTMGALHNGHASLIDEARQHNDIVVVSIFVNPTQFNNQQDFASYPLTPDEDLLLLQNHGCDIAFLPTEAEIYPRGTSLTEKFNFGELENKLEGAMRPGHFQGVAQVVARLLEIIEPKRLYLGQKDYQQCMVIQKLIKFMGRSDQITVSICATVREADGLAMSSRNRLLTEAQRAVAATIYQCLVSIQSKQATDSFDVVEKQCTELLYSRGFVPEYVALACAEDLTLLKDFDKQKKTIALIAARLGDIRLIDNVFIA